MPTPSIDFTTAAALERLRLGANPFASQVTTVGTAKESLDNGVPAFASSQLAELMEIIGWYRAGKAKTRAYPVIGERGAGKTHLFYALRSELHRQAAEIGEETLLVVVDRLSPGMDATDYLLWQIVNHFLAHRGDGGRMLGVISGRLTARLLGEALRQLAPHQRADLIPAGGFWSRLGRAGGAKTQARLDAVEKLAQQCEAKHPTPAQLRAAVDEAGMTPDRAVAVVAEHLNRTEPKDVLGWLRKELYSRLARAALMDDRTPFEDLHMGDFEDTPASVKNAGNISRRLLETWLTLLASLSIPVVVVFDQLEDYVNSPDKEQERLNRSFFTDSTSKFINELESVCILIFAEELFWRDMLNNAEAYTRERLTQPIPFEGRPAKPILEMPRRIEPAVVTDLIRQRLRYEFGDLDLTGLDAVFPFDGDDVKKFSREPSIRLCLRAMAKRYDDIVHKPSNGGGPIPPPPPPPRRGFREVLASLWEKMTTQARKEIESEESVGTPFVPKVQNALNGWLQCLSETGLTGSGPWHKVELVTDTKKGPYGYLTVIRTDGPNKPGLGIAAWLGQAKGQPYDLRERVGYFKRNPCPIRTLVMLRAEGEAALNGPATKDVYEKATRVDGRDVRVFAYEPRHLHALMAFTPWHQAALAELQTEKETNPKADAVFRDFLADRSKELLGWIDSWRQPKVGAAKEVKA